MPTTLQAPTPTPTLSLVATRLRNFYALLIVQIHVKRALPLGYPTVFIEPMAYIVGLSIFRYELHPGAPLGSSMLLFFLQGVTVFLAFNKAEAECSKSMTSSRNMLGYGPVTPIDIYVAHSLLATMNMFVLYNIVLVLHNFTVRNIWPEMVIWPEDLIRVYQGILLAGTYGFALGVLNASIEVWFPAWDRVYSILRRAQILLSGKMFVVDFMPERIRDVLWWNPLLHCVELTRSGFYDFYESNTMNLHYLLGSMLVVAVLAFSVERSARARLTAEREGPARSTKQESAQQELM